MKRWKELFCLILFCVVSAGITGAAGAWFMRPEGVSYWVFQVQLTLVGLVAYGMLAVVIVAYEVWDVERREKQQRGWS